MKKLFVTMTAVLIMCTACSHSEDTADLQQNNKFLNIAKSTTVTLIGESDSHLIQFGHDVCNAIDGGTTGPEIIIAGLSQGFSPKETGAITGAAVTVFCPDNQDFSF